MRIWKIASRWSNNGDPNSSIIDIFRNNEIVFAGREQEYIKSSVKTDDLVAISDGITIVSVGKVISSPKPITHFKINDIDINSGRFDYEDWVIGFKVTFFDLKKEERIKYNRGTFHAVNEPYWSKIKKLFDKYNQEYSLQSNFSINAKTCTLKFNSQNNGDTILGKSQKYVIPIYQRPYSWTDEQIRKFISDIFKSFYGYDKQSEPEPMFIGTMQLSEHKNITYDKNERKYQDIIDGQQRLTTFLVLLKLLKIKFPDNPELGDVDLDWLETRVNNGEQNKYLKEFISTENIENSNEISERNRYFQNALMINEILTDELPNEDDNNISFNLEKFLNHLFSNIYFVIIETKAGLSKTLQIFDAINTTGLDLNGGDIFKIRMYEYLTDKKNYGEKAFEDISRLYALIDENNNDFNLNINFNEILEIYKYILISKNDLPTVLYSYGTDTFYNRLFDTIFNINDWDYFKSTKDIELSLSEIEAIITIRYKWENMSFPTLEDAFSMDFILWSRYSRYAIIRFIFMYYFRNSENSDESLFEFIKALSKVFIIYSVRFQKSINEIHRFIYSLLKSLSEKPIEIIIENIYKKIGKKEIHNQGSYDLNWFLSENLTDNRRRKDIVCRLSAMLEEDYLTEYSWNIRKKIFFTEIDIEHIQSYNDENISERERILEEWKYEINSIGNLVVLERKINRSISNNSYENKKSGYKKSKFKIIEKQLEKYPVWDRKSCKIRKENELNKMLNYLFETR